MSRTDLQREADKLDMDMHRLIGRLEDFATNMRGLSVAPVDEAASALRSARWRVRELMHPEDVESTQ